jgi:hypothetical protein
MVIVERVSPNPRWLAPTADTVTLGWKIARTCRAAADRRRRGVRDVAAARHGLRAGDCFDRRRAARRRRRRTPESVFVVSRVGAGVLFAITSATGTSR